VGSYSVIHAATAALMQQWQRALLVSGAAAGLLLALAIHVSRSDSNAAAARGGRGGGGGIESLGVGSGSESDPFAGAVHLGAAGEYTHFLQATRLETPRSRNFPVTLKDVPHRHGPILPVDFIKEPHWSHAFGDDRKQEQGFNIASRQGVSDAAMLRCRKMVHMHSRDLISNKDVSIGLYLLNMDNRPSEPGVFYADFLMFLRQHDRPLELPDGSDPWNSLGFANAKNIDLIQTFGSSKGLRRIQGSFFYSPDLRWYPFDRQKMDITVEQIDYPVTEWYANLPLLLLPRQRHAFFPGTQADKGRGTQLPSPSCFADGDD